MTDVGALVLAVNAFLFANFMHPFWKVDAEAQDEEIQHFFKDMTICAGLVVLFWVFNKVGAAAPLTLTDPLFGPFQCSQIGVTAIVPASRMALSLAPSSSLSVA